MKFLVTCAANAAEIVPVPVIERHYRSPYTGPEMMRIVLSHERLRIELERAEAELAKIRELLRSVPETCPHCGDACDLLPKPKALT